MTEEEKFKEELEKGIEKTIEVTNIFFYTRRWNLLHRVPYIKRRHFKLHITRDGDSGERGIVRVITDVEGETIEGLKHIVTFRWSNPDQVNESLDALSSAIETILAKIMRKGINYWLNKVNFNVDAI